MGVRKPNSRRGRERTREPNITKEQALDITAAQNIEYFSREKADFVIVGPDTNRTLFKHWTWKIEFLISSDGECSKGLMVYVDMVTGLYKYGGISHICK